MTNALMAGFAGAVRRWPLVIVTWAFGAIFALSFGVLAGRWLDLALDSSVLSRSLLKEIDVDVLIDLWTHHHESLVMLGIVGIGLAVAQVALSIWLNGGIVRSVQDPDATVAPGEFWRRGLALYPVFTRLWLLATGVEVAAVVGLALVVRAARRWLSESPSEMPIYYVLGAALLIGGILLLLLVAIHDHARIFAARKGAGSLRAYAWAVRFCLRDDTRAMPLALALFLVGAGLWAVYQTVALWMPATTGFDVAASLLWGQVLLQGRSLLRVTAFAAQTELQAESLD